MKNKLLYILILISLNPVWASVPVLNFQSKEAIVFEKIINVGSVEFLEFNEPVSLAHYGVDNKSLNYLELEKLEPTQQGYKKFMIKAKAVGVGELNFKSGDHLIKVIVRIQEDFSSLESELNRLFGIDNPTPDEKIRVLSANLINNGSKNPTRIYLKGKVENAKNALLAVSFAGNALGDSGVKIFSNPGGQLRSSDLQINNTSSVPLQTNDNASFTEFYETTNKLIDTNNIYRDLVLASKGEQVISFIQVKEPSRFAIKVRFMEMDSKFIDDFLSSVSATSSANDVKGSFGSADLLKASSSKSNSLAGSGMIKDTITNGFIDRLATNVSSGSIVSGAVKLLDNSFLNINLNNLLQDGVLRVVNEFSLITHSGESVSLGKGTRFPIPRLNNGVGNSSISVEYIPIGFKGELKVTGLENQLIDVQLASRLSSAESSATTVQGMSIPIFNEEYVNSGALLKNKQEVILNAFMTETESVAKSSSLLGRVIPFLGSSRSKQKSKNLLFVSLQAEEIIPSSYQIAKDQNFDLPHLNFIDSKNVFADYAQKLEKAKINHSPSLAELNQAQPLPNTLLESNSSDPLELKQLEF
jgi:Flp pilus assembly secretin CpaC